MSLLPGLFIRKNVVPAHSLLTALPWSIGFPVLAGISAPQVTQFGDAMLHTIRCRLEDKDAKVGGEIIRKPNARRERHGQSQRCGQHCSRHVHRVESGEQEAQYHSNALTIHEKKGMSNGDDRRRYAGSESERERGK